MPFTGVDCSRHQGVVDWARVRAAGHDFAFLKCTDGVAYKHIGWFHTHAPKVKAAGLVLGAYHFLLDHHPGSHQARYYVNEVNKAGGFDGVVPIVDIEREADGTTPRAEHLRDFVHEFRRLVPGRQILIYTGKWYWVGVLGNPYGGNNLGPLWHSEYDGISPLDANVANGPELDTYGGWADCLVWQHTSSGSCPGVSGRVDLNIFYGNRSELAALAGAGAPASPDPEPEEPPTMYLTDCSGKPGLVVGLGGVQSINMDQRNLLKYKFGVEVKPINIKEWELLWALRTPPVDVDEATIAAGLVPVVTAAVLEALPDGIPGDLTVEDVADAAEAGVRRLFADAATTEG